MPHDPLGARVVRHGIVDSTSERAFAALAAGEARHGDVHVARGQSAGRGRRGSVWESAADEGLYASVVLRPAPPPPDPAGLTIAGGLATLDALRSAGLGRARLKWPNDVLAGGAKLAGILVEARQLDPARPAFVVGVGVNVAQRAFPAALLAQRAVTSLALEGVATAPEALLAPLLAALERRLQELRLRPAALAEAYLDATGLRARAVRVRVGAASHEGRLAGLDLQALSLEPAGGGAPRRLALAHVRALEAL